MKYEDLGVDNVEMDYRELRQIVNSSHKRFSQLNFDQSLSLPQKVNLLAEHFKVVLIDFQKVVDYLDKFIEEFDENLYETLEDVLEKWLVDGKIGEAFNQALLEYRRKDIPIDESDLSENLINLIYSSISSDGSPIGIKGNKSRNLFDKTKVTIGKYVRWTNGILDNNSNAGVSDYIKVTPNTKYVKSNLEQLAFYDKDKKYVGGIEITHNFTTPYNAEYVRITFLRDNRQEDELYTLMVCLGTKLYPYEKEGETLANENIRNNTISDNKLDFRAIYGRKSYNLFNKERVYSGYYMNYQSGKIVTAPSASFTRDYVEIDPSKHYTVSHETHVVFFDESYNFISGTLDLTFKPPFNAVYMKHSVINAQINILMINEGTSLKPYESFGNKMIQETIPNKLIKSDKIDMNIVEAVDSYNLFNKEKARPNLYVDYTNGTIRPVQGFWVSDLIPVKAGVKYSKTDDQQYAFFMGEKDNWLYVGGGNGKEEYVIPPEKAVYCIVTIIARNVDTYVFCEGELKGYVKYGLMVNPETIPSFNVNTLNKTNFIVDKNGNGDYTSITDCVMNHKGTLKNPTNITVNEGVYVENLNLIGKVTNIRGVNPSKCLVTNYYNDYHRPPLDIGANSFIENMSFIADMNDTSTNGGVNGLASYGLHADMAGRNYDLENPVNQGKSILRNCFFNSRQNHGVGLGTTTDLEYIFENCIINSDMYAGLFAHNYQLKGAKKQILTLKNNIISSAKDRSAIRLADANIEPNNDNFDTVFNFLMNTFYSLNGLDNRVQIDNEPVNDNLTGNIILGKYSRGNNAELLNK